MDNFTKEFYRFNYGIKNFDPVAVKPPARDVPQMYIPPYNGFGSIEDSLGSCFHLAPEPPRKDFIKMLGNASKNLRFLAQLDENDDGEGAERKFIINFSLATDTFMIYEQPARNSGRKAGKFLERQRIPRPGSDVNHPDFYGPQDLFIGNTVTVFNRRFKIVDSDLFVLQYLKDHAHRFPGIEKTIESLEQLHASHKLSCSMPAQTFAKTCCPDADRDCALKQLADQLRRAHFNRFHSIREAFLKLNANRDHYILPDELKTHINNLNIPVDEATLNAVFSVLDSNSDGKVSWEEFIDFVEQSKDVKFE
jgi:hypothetical protein